MNFLYKKSGKRLSVKQIVTDRQLLKHTKVNSVKLAIRLIKLNPHGWVLVSGDDLVLPVLGYSTKDTFDENNIPIQLLGMLNIWSIEINETRKQATVKVRQAWEKYKIAPKAFVKNYNYNPPSLKEQRSVNTKRSRAYESWQLERDVTLHTPTWAQGRYYNLYTPLDPQSTTGNDHTPTGCVATAMAEIMRYHRWPQHPQNLHAYNDNNRLNQPNSYQNIRPERPHTDYNWDAMLTTNLTSANDEISRLMQHAGVAVQMDYGYEGSAADSWSTGNVGFEVTNAMSENFSYRNRGIYFREDFDDSDWKSFLRTDLRQGFPVYYTGVSIDPDNSTKLVGHAFVIEGFSTDDGDQYFTINFGWGGYDNGDYLLDDIAPGQYNFYKSQRAIFSLKPTTYADVYENDNSHLTASYMRIGDIEKGHSIDPGDDTDWITFWNDTTGTVTIETKNSNNSGDTVMYLYDSQGNQIGYDDDGGANYLSKITQNLGYGRFYVKIIEYGQNDLIESYDLKISR